MTDQHPALAFLKRNGVAVGVAAVLAVSAGAVALNAAAPEPAAAPAPRPSILSTASLGDAVTGTASPAPSRTAAASPAALGASGAPAAGSSSAGPADGQQASAGSTAAPAPRATTSVVLGAHDQAPQIKDWEPVAEGFSKAFLNPSVGKAKWLAAIKPYVTADLYEEYKIADITRIPQDEVKYVTALRPSERAYVFTPRLVSGKDRFTATVDIQDSTGTWLVGHVGAPE